MRRFTHFAIKHGLLPRNPRLRRVMLRSIFRPIVSRDYGSGIDGWYELGHDVSPEEVARFKEWVESE